MINHLLILISGVISGFIIFQSAINAPLLFKKLPIDQARPFLRSVFPILFNVNATLASVMVILAIIFDTAFITLVIAVLTVILSTTCALLVPATNRAADTNDDSGFKRLHHISVTLTIVVLLANITLPFVL